MSAVRYIVNRKARLYAGATLGLNADEHIAFVEDRPFNDARYALDWSRIDALGWSAKRRLKTDLPAIAQWYADNLYRYEGVKESVLAPQRG